MAVRIITTIDVGLYEWLADRAVEEKRGLRDQASWFLEQKIIEDRACAQGANLRAQQPSPAIVAQQRERVSA